MRKRRWNDLSREQRTGILASSVVQLGLTTAALWDLVRRPRQQVRGHKGLWAAASLVSFIGPISYFVFGRRSS